MSQQNASVTVPLGVLVRMLTTLYAIAPREVAKLADDARAQPQRYAPHAHLRAMLEQLGAQLDGGRRQASGSQGLLAANAAAAAARRASTPI